MKNVHYFSKVDCELFCVNELDYFCSSSFFIPLNSKKKPYSKYQIRMASYNIGTFFNYHNLIVKLKNNKLYLEKYNLLFNIKKKIFSYSGHNRKIDSSKKYVEIVPKDHKILDELFLSSGFVIVGFLTHEETTW